MKNQSFWLAIIANICIIIVGLFVQELNGLRAVSIIQLILNSFFFIKGNRKFVSVGLVFFFLLFLFHCSRFVLLKDHGFEFEESILILSFKFVICCLSAISIGYFIVRSRQRSSDYSDSVIELPGKDILIMRKLSWAIIVFTLIPFLYVDITRLLYTMANGYGGMYSIGERDVLFKYFDPLSHFFRPAVILLMVSYSNTPKVATRILVLFCAYSLLMMFSGARIAAVVYILSMIVVYVRFVLKRIKLSQFVIVSFVSLLVFTTLPVLSSMRRVGISRDEFQTAASYVEDKGGSFSVAISEFGGSQVSVIYSIAFTRTFNHGLTYLASLICISPKLPSALNRTNITFTESFPKSYQESLGGSCIGEAYYNFGWFAVLFFLIVGALLGRLEYTLCRVNRTNLISSIFCLVLIPGLFTWVRDFFMILVFTSFWIPLFFRIIMAKKR